MARRTAAPAGQPPTFGCAVNGGPAMAGGSATAVVLVVMDGLRPDMVTADVMPNLSALKARGTDFAQARSVFPSVTAVAAASMATGAMPARHGVFGNEIAGLNTGLDTGAGLGTVAGRGGSTPRVFDLRDYRIVRGLLQTSSSGIMSCRTFADVLAAAGKRVAIVDAGMPVASNLLDPRAGPNRHWTFSTLGRDATATPHAWDEVVARFGFPPERELPRFDEVRFATDVLIHHVLAEIRPDVAVLWMSEPDATSRWREIGSLETENVLRQVDRQLGRIVDASEASVRAPTIIVASDHGQMTATTGIDLVSELRKAKFRAGDREHPEGAELIVTGQGYGAITFRSDDRATMESAVRWLMEQPWIGCLMTRGAGAGHVEGLIPGTLSTAICGMAREHAPDVLFTLRGSHGLDRHGLRGRGPHTWKLAGKMAGCRATHGGLSVAEMSTVLVAAGPRFQPGHVCHAVSGVLDIGPTVLGGFGLPLGDVPGRDLASVNSEERREMKLETGIDAYRQSVIMVQAGGGRLETEGDS